HGEIGSGDHMSVDTDTLTESIVNHSLLSVRDLTNTLLMHLSGPIFDDAGQAYEEYLLCKPALARLYEEDQSAFVLIARKVKSRFGIPLHALTKDMARMTETKTPTSTALSSLRSAKQKYVARFPELVDLVDEQGEVKFLVRSNNGSGVRTES